jgi:hypothetical protein
MLNVMKELVVETSNRWDMEDTTEEFNQSRLWWKVATGWRWKTQLKNLTEGGCGGN